MTLRTVAYVYSARTEVHPVNKTFCPELCPTSPLLQYLELPILSGCSLCGQIIIQLKDSALVTPLCEDVFQRGILGEVVSKTQILDSNDCPTNDYSLILQYDDSQLVEGTILDGCDINAISCFDATAKYLQAEIDCAGGANRGTTFSAPYNYNIELGEDSPDGYLPINYVNTSPSSPQTLIATPDNTTPNVFWIAPFNGVLVNALTAFQGRFCTDLDPEELTFNLDIHVNGVSQQTLTFSLNADAECSNVSQSTTDILNDIPVEMGDELGVYITQTSSGTAGGSLIFNTILLCVKGA